MITMLETCPVCDAMDNESVASSAIVHTSSSQHHSQASSNSRGSPQDVRGRDRGGGGGRSRARSKSRNRSHSQSKYQYVDNDQVNAGGQYLLEY